MPMLTYQVWIEVKILARVFIYFHILCMQAAKALVGLHNWPGSSEPSLLDNALSQGCGNTMPDLSNMVPFHPGQVENFYLLVLGQEQMY